jgi:hypothetical protein
MSLQQAIGTEYLSAEAVAAPVACRLTTGAGQFLAQKPLASYEHAQILVAVVFHPMPKVVVL